MRNERRRELRRYANIGATVVLDDGGCRVPAQILNLSGSGLNVRLDEDRAISDGYILFDHRMEPFRVAWQTDRVAGLHLVI